MIEQVNLGPVASFNCNGLKTSPRKRLQVFKWLKKYYKGVVMLQETHSIKKIEKTWERALGKQYVSYYSHSKAGKSGVMTFIPKRLEKNVVYQWNDDEGRFLVIQLDINNKIYTLINLYAPTQNHPQAQLDFLDNLEKLIIKFENSTFIIAGDYNIALNPKLDRWKPKNLKPSPAAVKLLNLCEMYNLVDIWRLRNPTAKRFTWRRKNPLQQSRIDLFCISDTLAYETSTTDINPGFCSDHSIITLHIKDTESQKRGRGYWKLNNSLLKDKEYIQLINTALNNYREDVTIDPRLEWDVIKMIVRRETVRHSIHRAKKQREQRESLLDEIKSLEEQLVNESETNPDTIQQYHMANEDLDKLEKEKLNGAILRSRTSWTEEGEKNTNFFLNLE